MRIIIAPAKKMVVDTDSFAVDGLPVLLEQTEQLKTVLQADGFIQAKAEGLDADISRFDSRLSGGELQRVAIARIILKRPRYRLWTKPPAASTWSASRRCWRR